jgi:hypothetical protein
VSKQQNSWRYIAAAAASALVAVYDTAVTSIYTEVMTERGAFQADAFAGTEQNPVALALLDSGSLIDCKSVGLIAAFVFLGFLSRTKYRVAVPVTLFAQLTLFAWINFATPWGSDVRLDDVLTVPRAVAQFYINHWSI